MDTYTGVKGLLSGQFDLLSVGKRLVPSGQPLPLVGVTVDIGVDSAAIVDDDRGVRARFEVGLGSGD